MTTTTAPHPSFLVGPPALYKPSAAADDDDSSDAPTGNTSVDVMMAESNNISSYETADPEIGLMENDSVWFFSSGNPCLDVFKFISDVVPSTPAKIIKQRLDLAWSHNPLQTLKLICNLRGVRGTGKSNKEAFYTVALWLHREHPKTLAGNIAAVAEFGYFKDLPEILYRLLNGAEIRQTEKSTQAVWKRFGYIPTNSSAVGRRRRGAGNRSRIGSMRSRMGPMRSRIGSMRSRMGTRKGSRMGTRKGSGLGSRNGSNRHANAINKKEKTGSKISLEESSRKLKEKKRLEMAKKVMEKITSDPDFRFLYERVADLFAEQLKSDIESLKVGATRKISLAAKWCPSIDSSFDRATLICELIARKFFPRESHPEYEGMEDAHYAYSVRVRLRKEVLVPLHKALKLPEVYMSAKQWSSIPYSRMASVAMKNLNKQFITHDEKRFVRYLEKVKVAKGKAKMAAEALLPHRIIAKLDGEVAELQWKTLVEDLSKKGKLKNCMAICAVSGSTSGVPLEVSVALGVLVSELSEDPWKGKLITFSADPQLQEVKGNSLKEKTNFVRGIECGKRIDFQKVFDRILEVAVEGKLKEEEMIKRVFVFSDMEFDQARASNSKSNSDYYNYWNFRDWDYEVMRSKYREKGYGNAVPEILFWNLSQVPVWQRRSRERSNPKGVALVTGFSKKLLKMFLEGSWLQDPVAVMEAAIAGEEYQKLVVLD